MNPWMMMYWLLTALAWTCSFAIFSVTIPRLIAIRRAYKAQIARGIQFYELQGPMAACVFGSRQVKIDELYLGDSAIVDILTGEVEYRFGPYAHNRQMEHSSFSLDELETADIWISRSIH